MRKIFFLLISGLLCIGAAAQTIPDEIMPRRAAQAAPKKIPSPRSEWDATRLYPQMVVLFEFADTVFSMPDPQAYYDSVLNVPGFNKGLGPGCAAEYMAAQSNGLLNLRFDVFGPFRISRAAKQSTSKTNYGDPDKEEALDSLFAAYPDMDYSIYDWNGDGFIDQIIYICAGPGANAGHAGFVWPNTSIDPVFKMTPDSLRTYWHSITSEGVYFSKYYSAPYGFGTLMHEFSHTLGLPDVYPTSGNNATNVYSVADGWDLMDAGNAINNGWCPANYTAAEKMFLKWLTPVELDADTTITGMLPVAEGGEAYLIRHTESEYLLLENRLWTGWDYGLPGQGLTIWHVDFDQQVWESNQVNNGANMRMYLYHADNLTYMDWRARCKSRQAYADLSEMIRCKWLSTSSYPWRTDSTEWVNDQLTETSTPALKMYHANEKGSTMLGKRISNIRMADDGSISFTLETDDDEAALDPVTGKPSSVTRKFIKDGRLLILRGGRIYTLTGTFFDSSDQLP